MSFTPLKSWRCATIVNVNAGSDKANQKDAVNKMFAQAMAFGQICSGSGNGSVGALDGVDRMTGVGVTAWSDSGSWFCIKNKKNGSQWLWAYSNSGQSNWQITHSPGGVFTGGTATARPTATDETVIYGTNSFFGRGGGGSNPTFRCNMWYASDDSCIRLSWWQGGIPFGDLYFDEVDDPTPGWSLPNIAICDKTGFDAFATQNVGSCDHWMNEFNGGGTGIVAAWGPAGSMPMTAVTKGLGIGLTSGAAKNYSDQVTQKNGISNTYRGIPRISMFNNHTGTSNYGEHGFLFDIWAVPHGFTAGSDTPLSGARTGVVIGDFLRPWDGTAFLTS